ncbi:MAG: hypothetical protein U0228_00765 [Myxococcaceae bacterium]
MNRTQAGIFALVGLSLVLSWVFARRGPVSAESYQECLSHADCKSTERCVVVPKGDGFATLGRCGEPCQSDADCGNGWVCRSWVAEKAYLVPDNGQPADVTRERACTHQSTP